MSWKKNKIVLGVLGGLLACCGGGTILGVIVGPSDADAPAPNVTTAPATPNNIANLPTATTPTADLEAERKAARASAAAKRERLEEARREAEAERERVERERREAAEKARREAEEAQRQAEEEEAQPESVYYANCSAARTAGAAPLYRGDPGYRSGLDRDGDGDACE